MHEAPHTSFPSRIPTGAACISCDYELAGLHLGDNCPECARPTRDSLADSEHRRRVLRHARRVRRAAILALIAAPALVAPIVGLFADYWDLWFRNAGEYRLIAGAVLAVFLVCVALAVYAWHLATAHMPEDLHAPAGPAPLAYRASRLGVRVSAPPALLYVGVTFSSLLVQPIRDGSDPSYPDFIRYIQIPGMIVLAAFCIMSLGFFGSGLYRLNLLSARIFGAAGVPVIAGLVAGYFAHVSQDGALIMAALVGSFAVACTGPPAVLWQSHARIAAKILRNRRLAATPEPDAAVNTAPGAA